MTLSNPMPLFCSALVLALPGLYLLGRGLGRRFTSDRAVLGVLSPGIGLAAWLLGVHIAGSMSRSFPVGLWAGTIMPSAIGLGLHLATLTGWRRGVPSPGVSEPFRLEMYVLAVAMAAMIIPAALGWCFHDEVLVSGHMSIASQISNGVYPPRNMTFPEFPYRYHYGFNLLCALVMAIFRLDVSWAIDVVGVVSWGYICCLLWVLGECLFGRSAGWPTALITMLGGRLPLGCPEPTGGPSPAATWLGRCAVEGSWIAPPFVSNHFQHPWALGMPLGLCAILISMQRTKPFPRSEVWRLATLGMVLVAVSLSQVVMFACLLGAITVVEWRSQGSVRRSLAILALGAGVLILARQLGGFFTPPPDGSALGIVLSGGIAPTLSASIRWNWESFGVLALLGIVGLALLPRERLLFGILACGSAIVLNLFKYTRTWDIVKFGNVLALCLGVGAGGLVYRVLRKHSATWVRALVLAGAMLAVWGGLAFLAAFAAKVRGIPPGGYPRKVEKPSPQDARAIEWLRLHASPEQLVYRQGPAGLGYALWGGLPPAAFGWTTARQFGFGEQRLLEREYLQTVLPDAPGQFRHQHVDWFVTDQSNAALEELMERWIRRGEAIVRAEFPPVRIVEVTAAPVALDIKPLPAAPSTRE